MSIIHIANSNGQTSQHSEDEVRNLLLQNAVSGDTLYWKEGMPNWEPLRNLFPEAGTTIITAAPPPVPAETYKFTKDPLGLTRLLKVMLWLQLGLVVISIFSDFAQLSLATSDHITHESADANDARQGAIGLLYLVIFIITAVIFLMWIYRANVNSRGFGAVGMQFTSGWSIGYYFIPFVNLVRPYHAMKEIWQISANPKDWQAQPGSALLGWWWALWLISNIAANISFRVMNSVDSQEALERATVISIGTSLIDIPLNAVAVMLITRIIERQVALTRANA